VTIPFGPCAWWLQTTAHDCAVTSRVRGGVSERMTADICSYAIRRKDHAAAQCWDGIMQRSRSAAEKSKTVN
jgi:hypothetical protein